MRLRNAFHSETCDSIGKLFALLVQMQCDRGHDCGSFNPEIHLELHQPFVAVDP